MLPLTWVLLACAGTPQATDTGTTSASSTVTTATTGTTSGSTTTTGTTGTTAAGSPPTLGACDAYCYLHDVGSEVILWAASCQADDPDGLEDLYVGEFTVRQGGADVVTDAMGCDKDTGLCLTSFKEDTFGTDIQCSAAGSYTFTFTVLDWAGNRSNEVTVTARSEL